MEKFSSPQFEKEKLQLTPQEKILFSQLAIYLSKSFVQTRTFGVEHSYTKETIQQFYTLLKDIMKEKEEIILCIVEGNLTYNLIPLEKENFLVQKLADIFSKTMLVSLKFKKDTTEEDFKKLLNIFCAKPEEILKSGGVEELAKGKNITSIEINPIKYELLEKGQKIIGEDVQVFEIEEGAEEIEKKENEEQLLQLVGEAFKEETAPLNALKKIRENPLQSADSLIEAIKIIDRVGLESSQSLASSVIQKLIFIKNELRTSIEEDKPYPQIKEINQFSNHIEKQLKLLSVSENIQPFIREISTLNVEIADTIKALDILIGVSKENIPLKRKVKIAQGITQRSKKSSNFEPLVRNILNKRGFSEEEITQIIEEGLRLFKEKSPKKIAGLEERIISIIERISEKDISLPLAKDELNKTLSKTIEERVRLETKKIIEEKGALEGKIQKVEDVLNNLEYGIVILDEEGRIIFINKPGEDILNLSLQEKIEEPLLKILKVWSPDKKENLSLPEDVRIFTYIKSIQRSATGEIESIILYPPKE